MFYVITVFVVIITCYLLLLKEREAAKRMFSGKKGPAVPSKKVKT
jgi:asparagine N-glycosylation enzyme membrane subunit Stt3